VRPVTIVLGCGDIGSAVALALHASGFSVVLVDEADPAWHRRGMAFTNAWYVGNAELDGEGACFCASLKSIPSVLVRRLIAATTWSWPGVVGALAPTVLVDARGRKRRGSEILLGRVPFTIGIGVDFVEGENVDVAIDLAADSSHGPGEEPNPLEPASRADFAAGCGADCIVEAARHGRFMTERRIGDAVRVGQIVGGLGNEAIAAPAGGVLLGLAARGARIEPGDKLVEVDPTGVAYRCYGVGAGPRHVAANVMSALSSRRVLSGGAPTRIEPVIADDVAPLIDVVGPHAPVQDRAPS
jgi:xanthine dehydrogenase accessory factor